jgi:membrane protease YdiL (CAAX protease family)
VVLPRRIRPGRPTRWARLGARVRRLPDPAASGVVVSGLVAANLVRHLLHPPWWVAPFEAAVLVGFARLRGLSWVELGLAHPHHRSGIRWGVGVIGAVATVYVVGVLLPATRPAFRDARYHAPVPDTFFTAFVVIPLGTVVLGELAFRSVLWGVLARRLRPWQVLLTTAGLFGLWHVIPAAHVVEGNEGVARAVGEGGSAVVVLGTVAVTTVGGLFFGELRRRSGSVLAPIGAHWATNALGVLAGLVAWRLPG